MNKQELRVTGEEEDAARFLFTRMRTLHMPEGEGSAEFALGEAALMLTDDQREELYARVSRDMVAEAAACVAMARVQGMLVEELEKTKRDLRHAQDEISHIKSTLSL